MLQAVLTLPEQPGQHKGTVAVLRDSYWCLCSHEGGGFWAQSCCSRNLVHPPRAKSNCFVPLKQQQGARQELRC